MAKIILIVGNVGAGKSTLAAQLSQQVDAHVFCVDSWLKNLYLMDMPNPPSYLWALERTERIELQMLEEALKLLDHGVSIILDIGFFTKKQRDRVKSFLLNHGQSPLTYYLDVDKDTRWQRVSERNLGNAETFKFEVSREIFDFCETIFEPLNSDELKQAIVL